jgi:trehalose 6-phosphate phosphatase
MIDILSPVGRRVIREIGQEPFILAFDFDGTVAPIVDEAGDAVMPERTRALLRALAAAYPCAVVSGRARADVLERIGSVPLAAAFGNHGAESTEEPAPPSLRHRLLSWASAIQAAATPEIEVEDKGYSLSIHYRHARDPAREVNRLRAIASALPGVKVLGGHAVLNVLPAESPTKDDAVAAFARQHTGRPVLFLGDDEVDEDAFRSPLVRWPIRVGHKASSDARFFLDRQQDIDLLLQALIAAAAGSRRMGVRGWQAGREPSHGGGS